MMPVPTAPLVHYLGDACAWGAAFLAGRWVHRNFPERIAHLARQTNPSYFICMALGGVIGAWLMGSLNTLGSAHPTLSHSIAGALAGAIIAVELWKWRHHATETTGAAFVLPITLGIVVGRWGCLFAGLADGTYGVPTTLPWAVNLGDGIGRHPVQIYESLSMLLFALIYLHALKRGWQWPWEYGFQVMIIVYAVQRFIWEFFKPYPHLLWGLNLFHFLALGMIFYGVIWIGRHRSYAAILRRG